MFKQTTIVAALALACLGSTSSLAGHNGNAGASKPAVRPVATTTVAYTAPTAAEAADMQFMREEEKLARDIYIAMDAAWGVAPFAQIAVAEQRHMDAMLLLLSKYQLEDPAAGNAAGEFTDPALQALYDSLLAEGSLGLASALNVGARIEEIDIRDNLDAMATSTLADADSVYASLTCASRNHLRSFARTLEVASGTTYVAQVLPQADVDAILDSPMERCGSR